VTGAEASAEHVWGLAVMIIMAIVLFAIGGAVVQLLQTARVNRMLRRERRDRLRRDGRPRHGQLGHVGCQWTPGCWNVAAMWRRNDAGYAVPICHSCNTLANRRLMT